MSRWDEWKAQVPANDFAARTVTAALRERGSKRRLDARRWAGLAAAAAGAVMVAGVAWGSWAQLRGMSTQAAPPAPTTTAAPRSAQLDPRLLTGQEAAKEAALAAVAAEQRRVQDIRTRLQPARRVAPAARPDAGYNPISPHCDCMPGDPLCSCLGAPGPGP
jgi:hypothetical protein